MHHYKNILETKKEVIQICRLMHQQGFVSATDGNVSVRLDDNAFLITPSGINKCFLNEESLIIIDKNGTLLDGLLKPSSEFLMHIKAYENRPDIKSVIHAHPPHLLAFSLVGEELPEDLLPEVILTIGKIPTASYATPTTPEVPAAIAELIKLHDAITLAKHGSLTVGKNIFDAYNKLEKIEHAAHIAIIARSFGKVSKLDEDSIEKLEFLASKLGIRRDLALMK